MCGKVCHCLNWSSITTPCYKAAGGKEGCAKRTATESGGLHLPPPELAPLPGSFPSSYLPPTTRLLPASCPSNPLHLPSAIYRNARPPDTADSPNKTSSCQFGLRQPIKTCWQSRPHAASFLFQRKCWLDLHSCGGHRKDDAPCVCTLRGKIQVTADCWTGHASVTKPLLRPLRIVECLQAPWASKEEEHQDQFCLGGQCCKRTPVSFAFPVRIHVFNFFIPPPTIRFSYSCRLLSASPNSSADGCLKVFAADVSRAVY